MHEDRNIKTVQSGYDAFNRGDIPGLLSHLSESVVWTIPGSKALPLSGTRHGRNEVRQFFEQLKNTIHFSVFNVVEYIAQDDRVVALVHYEGKYLGSGRAINCDACMVWTVENGKLTKFVEYTDTEAHANAALAVGRTGA
jgi:ketosteroid isomerase-like protein